MKHPFQKYTRRILSLIIIMLFSTSLWQLAAASRIQGKAIIAQQLLEHSWHETLHDNNTSLHRPWPWSDSWPVAKLIVPEHDIEQIVLAGDSGSSLAFAPGYSLASSLPNSQGTTVISAHRDTHFSFLKNIKRNEMIYLQTSDKTVVYKVYDLQIANSTNYVLPVYSDEPALVLVTCYPFESITSGGPLRYLVFATQLKDTDTI